MKSSKLSTVMMLILLSLMVIPHAFAQGEPTRLYVAKDGAFTFMYPEAWRVQYDSEFDAAVVSNQRVDVYVFPPVTGEDLMIENATVTAVANSLVERFDGSFELGTVQMLDMGDQSAARLDFVYANTPGFFLIVDLGDDTFGVLEPFGLQGDTQVMDEAAILEIAASYRIGVGYTNPLLGHAIAEYGNYFGQ